MKKILKQTIKLLNTFGLNPYNTMLSMRGLPSFFKNYREIKSQLVNNSDFTLGAFYPIFGDKYRKSGTMSGDYFHQDLHVAKKIFHNNPIKHIDIGSRIDGFVAHVACFREIEVFDIRPQQNNIDNIKFVQADLMSLDTKYIDYCDSVSSLHAIEHFGLGRYGDPIDVNGHIKGLDNIYKILKTNGKFYFSVPIGAQRINFNAHRVFNISYLLNFFKNKYNIDDFSYIDDKGDLHKNIPINSSEAKNNFGCDYGCGIFEMTKL